MSISKMGLRKAAILVAALDAAAADRILDQLTTDEARRVRDLVIDLGDVDQREQQQVIQEFFRVGPAAPADSRLIPDKSPPGIELDGRLARRLAMSGNEDYAHPAPLRSGVGNGRATADARRSFGFLDEADVEKLASVLSGERPQTIALVLSRLSPERAGAVLAQFAAPQQVEIVRRLADLEETDPEILRDVEAAIEARLSQQIQTQRRRVAGMQAISGILEATDRQLGRQILDNLAAHDLPLAERLGSRPVEFDDLADLPHIALAELAESAGRDLLVPALLGAPPKIIDALLRTMPLGQATAIRQELENPGPIRLRDVELARRHLAAMARRLAYPTRRSQPQAA